MCTDTDDGIECSCEGAFKGATVVNGRATCTEKTCADASCGSTASCFNRDVNDGYECVCNSAYHPGSVWNGAATCTERSCLDLGLDLMSCGVNGKCVDLPAGQGVRCECVNDAFEGTARDNAAVTDCMEKN
ncbi:MAG: hypothetical protein VX115_03065, partial [Candidatus Thermoplasmatota archaeon]|nr:hypothetical protein [Candidatus Thermoplasmatota archaeon]